MILTAYFTETRVPKASLSPTITVYDVTNDIIVVSGSPMTEVGDGLYVYSFPDRNTSSYYTYICDSVSLLGFEKYAVGYIDAEALVSEEIDTGGGGGDERRRDGFIWQIRYEDKDMMDIILMLLRIL